MFKLIKGWIIAPYDNQNWMMYKNVKAVSKEGEPYTKRNIDGTWSKLDHAWRGAVEVLALESKDYPDLIETIEKLKELRKDLEMKTEFKIVK